MSQAAARPPLGVSTKINYGLGAIAQGVGAQALATSTVTLFLFQVIGMPVALVTGLITISVIIDAVLDPLLGRWSDGFRSKWGRRHPFMYASALPIAACIFLLWHPPAQLGGAGLAVFVLALLIAVRLFGSLYTIPSDALAPELAPDYHERTGLISFRYYFGLVGGGVMGLVLNLVFLRRDAAHPLGVLNRQGYENFGLLAASATFAAILVSALATHRYIPYLYAAPQRRMSLGQVAREVGSVLTNRSLLVVMLSGLISGVVGGMNGTLGVFYNLHFWGFTPQTGAFLGLVAGLPAALVAVIAAPIVSRALDKKRTMITVFFLSIFTGVIPISLKLVNLMPPITSPWLFTILAADGFVSGTLGLIGFIIIASMIADVVEDAAVKTGVRSEGLLFAANGLLPKFTTAIGILLGNMMLEMVHFPETAQAGRLVAVDPAIMRHLALLQLPVGAVLNLVAIGVLIFYRIDRSTHEANLEALRLGAMVTEPPLATIGGPPVTDPTAIVT